MSQTTDQDRKNIAATIALLIDDIKRVTEGKSDRGDKIFLKSIYEDRLAKIQRKSKQISTLIDKLYTLM